jgi:hypothetical protein
MRGTFLIAHRSAPCFFNGIQVVKVSPFFYRAGEPRSGGVVEVDGGPAADEQLHLARRAGLVTVPSWVWNGRAGTVRANDSSIKQADR